MISGMFLVFGTFTIAAGVLLVLTIVLMLAESRRSELGVLRAIGVTRSDARALAVMEGVVIASLSGVLGSLLGLLLARGISAGFSSIFAVQAQIYSPLPGSLIRYLLDGLGAFYLQCSRYGLLLCGLLDSTLLSTAWRHAKGAERFAMAIVTVSNLYFSRCCTRFASSNHLRF